MRFVNELFALLSGLSKDVVPGYFEQSFSTMEIDIRQWISSKVFLYLYFFVGVWEFFHFNRK
jgi:hypothetical protein